MSCPKVLVSEVIFFSAWKLFSKSLNLLRIFCVAAERKLISRVICAAVSKYERRPLTKIIKITRRFAKVALIAFWSHIQRFWILSVP